MKEQASFRNSEGGALYLVPTPIGNLEDMTYRAVRTLQEADLIAAEDTRQTRKLCTHFEIPTPLISYHEHNKQQAGTELLKKGKDGKVVALVSDAGMPGVSDPGEDLVKLFISEEIPVIALPGANAALTTLVASGLSAESFQFCGFLPRSKKQRGEKLSELVSVQSTLLFYEAPHRLKATLAALQASLGNRRVCLGREITKKFEEYQRGTLDEAIEWCDHGMVKGEFCLVVEGASEVIEEQQWWEALTPLQHVDHYIALGLEQKEAIKQAASDRGVPKREVYQAYHQ
ncbi:16S rRNA (cytidine(1402)-2'-O)-methyltransferase [Shouchella shacheensis]|uniref:16S rRNA (cytidine(1402)-2'-O)-methyltransferase n=1 Tax=Shouchella shacheensis TaxID=1649580 RepID=UPI00073FD9C6|nr:16S rRNA (cytidine(1402)-2'-O)-methyltransferase [Shouchella shacheensis]